MERHERFKLRDTFQALFEAEAAKRDERRNYDADGTPEWVRLEREALMFQVNLARSQRGKPPIEFEDYERMEWRCMGHVDYSSKLALGCMELVLDHG